MGIKLWSLCESKSGYLLDWDVYTRRGNNPLPAEHGLGYNVVMKLMDNYGFLNVGHRLYVDNFYTSPVLFEFLIAKGTAACGTVRLNRRGLPTEIKPKNLILRKGDDPAFFRKGDVLLCCWHDTSIVNFLSTMDENSCVQKTIRSKENESGYRDVSKPTVAVNYNQFMGGVDLFDQKCTSYHYGHKCRKWYHAIYHFIREQALFNSFIIFKATNPSSVMTSKQFRQNIADNLCASIPRNAHANKGRRSLENLEENETRLTERHFAATYEEPNYKPNCTVCSFTTSHPKKEANKIRLWAVQGWKRPLHSYVLSRLFQKVPHC